jgi:hypothetical protein
MRLPNTDPTVEISATSGMLLVEVRPSRSWPVLVFELLMLVVFAGFTYQYRAKISSFLQAGFVIALVSGILGLIFQFSGSEILEIDTNKITLSKVVHEWERKRQQKGWNNKDTEAIANLIQQILALMGDLSDY